MAKPEWALSEQALVAEFMRQFNDQAKRWTAGSPWTIYPETAGWDLLLAHQNGVQIGLEAKLALNPKVIAQALKGQHPGEYASCDGPDYRGVLVPAVGRQHHLTEICDAIGVGIITVQEQKPYSYHCFDLPDGEDLYWTRHWHNWCPVKRCDLPDYVPDVPAGVKSPVLLSHWKIKAIKLLICLDRKGWVDRADMRAVKISPTRWTDRYHGFLASNGQGQYVRSDYTPDLRRQHPENYAQIEADVAEWGKALDPFKIKCPDWLLGGVKADA